VVSDDRRPNAVFNIGSQQGIVSNVAGDMTVYGGQHWNEGSAVAVREELAKLRIAIHALDLDPALKATATRLVEEADGQAHHAQPAPEKIGSPIEKLTRLLKDSGALVAAGAALINPLQGIGTLLGAAGQIIVRMIG